MKILPFGSSRIITIWDNNHTFLEPVQYTTLDAIGGKNVVNFSHDIFSANFILDLIKNNKKIKNDDINY